MFRPYRHIVSAALALSACGAALGSPVAGQRKPNEVGLIPVLMYHSVGERSGGAPMRYDKRGLNISPDTFRRQLELMWEAGWYPVNMRDALTARLAVPAGKTPVVITFDDARGSQLRLLPSGQVDPDCAVGILDTFSATHPDWPRRASFYVLPRSSYNPVPFWQRGKERQKLAYLVQAGYEVGNHSTTHRFLMRMSVEQLRKEVAECVRYVRKLEPRATMDTFCVPYGGYPRVSGGRDALMRGEQGGTVYQNRCLLEAWGGPTYPATHRKFDATYVTRTGADPGEIERLIRNLSMARGMRPYVSDGDPNVVTVPSWAAKLINPARLEGARLVVYPDGPPPGVAKKAKTPAKKHTAGKPAHGKRK